jgi:hypothetical protein
MPTTAWPDGACATVRVLASVETRDATWLGGVHEIIRCHFETEPLVEPTGVDTAKIADEFDGLSAASFRGLDGGANELFADAPRALLLVHDQWVEGDQVPRALKLTPRGHRDQPDDVAVTLGHDHLGRGRRRQLGDDGVWGHRPSELVEEFADARRVFRDGDAQRRVHLDIV